MRLTFDSRMASGFCCTPLKNSTGYTWTLTSLLGSLLREAENRFGPRDRSWTVLGIEFCGSNPKVWYPGNCGNVSILLSDNASRDPGRALFQLAHEVIHLLAPTGGKQAPVIEEGLATIFSEEVSARYALGFHTGAEQHYANAAHITMAIPRTETGGHPNSPR